MVSVLAFVRGARRLWPFAALAALGWLLALLPGQPMAWAAWGAAGGLTVMAAVAVVFVPWRRLPAWGQLSPALAYLGAVALLRQAAGGASGGAGSLVLLPVIWMALYGTRAQLVTVIGGVAAVWVLPLLLIGAPAYPVTGWRGCVLFVALSAMIGVTVQRLVGRVREHAAALHAHARERDRLVAQLEALATTDPLTGLRNLRAWNERLGQALADVADEPLTVAMLDLDSFKALNDAHGHHAGDRALQDTAVAWQAELRPCDLLARVGGDEFALLLPGCSLPCALQVLERLRAATAGAITWSAGTAEWDRRETSAELQARADALLYQAKRAGRDRTASRQLRAI